MAKSPEVRGYQPQHVAAYPVEYLAGIDLFNAREFHAAHDVWEERWRDDAGPQEKLFLQALIQAAVVFHYLEIGRPGAARKMLERCEEKFDRLGLPFAFSLDVAEFRSELKNCLSWLTTGPNPEPDSPAFDAPTIRLTADVTPLLDA